GEDLRHRDDGRLVAAGLDARPRARADLKHPPRRDRHEQEAVLEARAHGREDGCATDRRLRGLLAHERAMRSRASARRWSESLRACRASTGDGLSQPWLGVRRDSDGSASPIQPRSVWRTLASKFILFPWTALPSRARGRSRAASPAARNAGTP